MGNLERRNKCNGLTVDKDGYTTLMNETLRFHQLLISLHKAMESLKHLLYKDCKCL